MRKKYRKKTPLKKKKKKKLSKNIPSDIKGFFCLAISFLFFISLISFSQDASYKNWLGVVGHTVAFSSLYLLGLSSYLLTIACFYLGICFFAEKTFSLQKKIAFLSLFLISASMLLTVYANTYPQNIAFLDSYIFKEMIYHPLPSPHTHMRYHLGGAPLYYLYADLAYVKLQTLFGNIGNVLIFSLMAFFSFLLFTQINLFSKIKQFYLFLYKRVPMMKIALKKLFVRKKTFQKKPIKTYSPKILPIKKKQQVDLTIKRALESTQKKDLSVSMKTACLLPSIPPKNTPIKKGSYAMPSSSLLSNPEAIDHPSLIKELKKQAEILEETLKSFGIEAKVGQIHCGPTITLFEVHPSIGVKVQKIKALERDIALNLQAKSIRLITPIPGKAAVGVEIPSIYPQEVSLKEMLFHYKEQKRNLSIPMLLGKTVTGEYVMSDLSKMPHCLIAGATGSGKSVCINTIVMSILMNAHPHEVKLLMIDPKKVELTQYSKLPHMIAPVITEPHGAYAALSWLVKEMQNRYDILKHLSLRNITAFNKRKIKPDLEAKFDTTIPEKMPFIVAIVDEFADLMMVSSTDLETPIARIAQMARAVGIHLILATQRPSREVITGIIKANFPSRIAFKVASRINSQIILDETGAESLLGNGDLLFLPPGSAHLVRAQGAYISDDDINLVIRSICEKNPPDYLIPSFDAFKKLDPTKESGRDALYEKALNVVLQTKNASTTFLQRKLKIGYARAASLIDELEENGIIGPPEGSRPRQILVNSKEDL